MLVKAHFVDWNEYCEKAQTWIREHGLDVWPNFARPGQQRLGSWWAQQRMAACNGTLSEKRRLKLEAIGFPLDPAQKPLNYQTAVALKLHIPSLAAYYAEHGHYYVAKDDHDHNFPRGLGSFVARLRERYKKNPKDPLFQRLFCELENLEASLKNPNPSPANRHNDQQTWRENFKRYKKAARRLGHTHIPQGREEFAVEARWLAKQRRRFRLGSLPKWQQDALREFGTELVYTPSPSLPVCSHWESVTPWLEDYLVHIVARIESPETKRPTDAFRQYLHTAGAQQWLDDQRARHARGQLPYCMQAALDTAHLLHSKPVSRFSRVDHHGWFGRYLAIRNLTQIANLIYPLFRKTPSVHGGDIRNGFLF